MVIRHLTALLLLALLVGCNQSSDESPDADSRTPTATVTTPPTTNAVSGCRVLTAAADGDLERLRELRPCFTPPDSKAAQEAILAAGRTAQVEAVALLIEWRVSPNTTDARGLNPGFYAVTPREETVSDHQAERLATLRLLANAGLNLEAATDDGISLIQAAAFAGYERIVRFLASRDVDVSHQDSRGQTPLMAAVSAHSLPTVRVLLAAGADPETKDHNGNTALTLAKSLGAHEIAAVLARAN